LKLEDGVPVVPEPTPDVVVEAILLGTLEPGPSTEAELAGWGGG